MSVRRPTPILTGAALRCLLLLGVTLSSAGCTSPLLDGPGQVREDRVPLAPLLSPFYSYAESGDGSSWSWSSLLWLVGADAEADRSSSRVLPFWWHATEDGPRESTLLFPLYFAHTAPGVRWRFYTPLWGFREDDDGRQDWLFFGLYDQASSAREDRGRSGLLFVYDHEDHVGPRGDLSLIPILGLAHLLRFEWGYPGEGVTVPALGREASRRWELLNLFGFLTLAGYDDVGDRREFRLLTLLSNEMLSPIRSWRGRGDDPFVSEWIFPLYMNQQDAAGGWLYVGPFWGRIDDQLADEHTDWWLLGLVSRTRSPDGEAWKLCGLTVAGP